MQTVLIANPKGGSGKTTLATNLAGLLAGKKQRVVLADEDRQQSSAQWLARRPALFPPILAMPDEKRELRAIEPHWMVVDSPAALAGDTLKEEMRRADAVLVPISPSAFDMAATGEFLGRLAQTRSVKDGATPVGLVGMRVDSRTRSAADLDEFLKQFPFPVIAHLRDTQLYVYGARDGLSVFDMPRSRAEQDREQWRPLARWVGRLASAQAA